MDATGVPARSDPAVVYLGRSSPSEGPRWGALLHGRRLVVRNGSHQPREVLTSAGAVEVTVPRVNDRRVDPDTGERARFASAILPPWCRKTEDHRGTAAAVPAWAVLG